MAMLSFLDNRCCGPRLMLLGKTSASVNLNARSLVPLHIHCTLYVSCKNGLSRDKCFLFFSISL